LTGKSSEITCANHDQILRLLNTNVDGKQKVMYALTKIKGVGRRYSNLVCKKADVDLNKRYDLLRTNHDILKNTNNLIALVSSPPKSSSESSPSSRTPPSTRSLHGSSTDSAISSMARTPTSLLTVSTPSSVRISSASRRSALTVVFDTTGVSVSVVSTPRPPVAVAGPSVSPRRRVVKLFIGVGYGWTGVTAGFSIFLGILRDLLSSICSYGCTLDQSHESKAFK
jgi:hypothetical protein